MILLFAGKLSRLYSNLKNLIIRKEKFAGKPSRVEPNLRKPQKFSTANDLHYTVLTLKKALIKLVGKLLQFVYRKSTSVFSHITYGNTDVIAALMDDPSLSLPF